MMIFQADAARAQALKKLRGYSRCFDDLNFASDPPRHNESPRRLQYWQNLGQYGFATVSKQANNGSTRYCERYTMPRAAAEDAKAREASCLASLPGPSNFPPQFAASKTPQQSQTTTPSSHTKLNSTHTFGSAAAMGFTDLVSDAGLTLLNNWVKTRSYVLGYVPLPHHACFPMHTYSLP